MATSPVHHLAGSKIAHMLPRQLKPVDNERAGNAFNWHVQRLSFTDIQSVLNSFTHAIVLLDANGMVAIFNQAAAKLMESIGEGIKLGDALIDRLPDYRQENVRSYFDKVLEGQGYEYNVLYPNGIWLFVQLAPVMGAGGSIHGINVNLRHITWEARPDKEVRIQDHFARNTYKGILIINNDFKILWANKHFTDLTGYSLFELAGTHLPTLLAGSKNDSEIYSLLESYSKKRLPFQYEFPGHARKKVMSCIRLEFQPIPGNGNESGGFIGVQSDIIEEKKIANELEVLSMLANETDNGALLIDTNEGRITWTNKGFSRISRYRKSELLGRKINKIFDGPRNSRKQYEQVIKNISCQTSFNSDLPVYCKDGRTRWLRLAGKKFTHSKDQSNTYFILCTDIGEHRKMEDAYKKNFTDRQKAIAAAVLRGKDEEKERLGRELHDNINQMLAAVKLQLGYCASHYDRSRNLLGKTLGYLEDTINEVRKLSHRMVIPRFNDSRLADEIETMVSQFEISHQIMLEIKNVKDVEIPVDVKKDIYRIIQEQLTNVAKHAGPCTVMILLQAHQGSLTLRIQDNGAGFDPSIRKKGIGLTNIARRVEMQNGQFYLESTPGAGCTLVVVLPIFREKSEN